MKGANEKKNRFLEGVILEKKILIKYELLNSKKNAKSIYLMVSKIGFKKWNMYLLYIL